jgi:hypothetical protein
MKRLAILLCSCAWVFAYGQKIIFFHYSDCDRACNEQKVTSTVLEHHELMVKLVLQENCGADFYAQVVKVSGDTLRLLLNSDSKGIKSSGQQSLSFNNLCLCYFNFTIRLSGIKKMPAHIVINDVIQHPYFGLVDFERYTRHAYKSFENNSSSIGFNELTELLGQKRDSKAFKSLCKELGKDSILTEWDGPYELAVEFPADALFMSINRDGYIYHISVLNGYKGTMPNGISYSNNMTQVETALGAPDKKDEDYAETYAADGTASQVLTSYMLFYKQHLLTLRFDTKGKMNGCWFSKQEAE